MQAYELCILAIFAAFSAAACTSDEESVRGLLASEQAVWRQDVRALSDHRTVLAARMQHLSGAVAEGGTGRLAEGRRVDALLLGGRQSIVDLDSAIRQAVARVEIAIKRDVAAGNETLKQEGVRMLETRQLIRDQLLSAEREIERMARN